MAKKGTPLAPVTLEGKTIARTFWGKAWCDNLERYSDFSNRLPRGRTYVRNGSVVDLQVEKGQARAKVMGSQLYQVKVSVKAVAPSQWSTLCTECAEGIDSLVELLQGRFSKGVMERICAPEKGLFPSPEELSFSCSCPDYADMCKHVAATLYGVGARLDERPELLFTLRDADHLELIASAGSQASKETPKPAKSKVLDASDLSAVFGLDLEEVDAVPTPAKRQPAKKKPSMKKTLKKPVAKAARPKLRGDDAVAAVVRAIKSLTVGAGGKKPRR